MQKAEPPQPRIDRDASFQFFIYPFSFADNFAERAEAVRSATWCLKEPVQVWQAETFPADDLLPHVREYLNSGAEGSQATAYLWKLSPRMLNDVHGLTRRGQVEWFLDCGSSEHIQFDLHDVRLALFSAGVGFLTIHATPVSESVRDWQAFLNSFRFLRRGSAARVHARRREWDAAARSASYVPFHPPLAGGTERAGSPGACLLPDVLEALLASANMNRDEATRWWDEPFIQNQLIPYGALFFDGHDPERIPERLYRVHNLFHEEQKVIPSPADLSPDQLGLLGYADRQWFVTSLDGVVFTAFDAPAGNEYAFFRETLPTHLKREYFLLMILALQQKFVLMKLSRQVAEYWATIDESGVGSPRGELQQTRSFETVLTQLLRFTARGYFVQVGQRDHHHRFYQRLREKFLVEPLYEEVRNEIYDINSHLMLERAALERVRDLAAGRRDRELEFLIAALALFLGVPSLTLAFADVHAAAGAAAAARFLLLGFAVGAIGLLLVFLHRRRA